ncbi:kinase-like domain-containing protein [Fomitopsis serialis]|uniref:kinase-like domain-containing protein n=1 Tax=Fomitopsis serialis TaxID=139415 RepID=UPI002007DB1B|nr:kinase-like domain-containing protein [Neoantrodia serialis]KAH9930573.1 kinase-like domain-containing protein [Neoantrodia serialis]
MNADDPAASAPAVVTVAPPNQYGFRDPRSVPGKPRGDDILYAWRDREARRTPLERWLRHTLNRLKVTLPTTFRRVRDFMWRLTLGRWLWVKRGHGTDMIEVETMRMVAAHTNIPVPRIWTHFVWRGARYIIMDRARGVPLSNLWYDATPQYKEEVCAQLANYFRELRSLPTPYGPRVCSLLGGPVRDFRLRFDHTGPFENEDDFNHRGARFGWDIEYLPAEGMPQLVAEAHSMKHPIAFTHGDLDPRNVMVDGSRITAIIDWECAGWFPAHWEYCKSIFATLSWDDDDHEWVPWLRSMVPVYDTEARADKMLVRELFTPLL